MTVHFQIDEHKQFVKVYQDMKYSLVKNDIFDIQGFPSE